MAWTDLSLGLSNGCTNGSFMSYDGKLAWLTQVSTTATIRICDSDGSNLATIGTFTNIVFSHMVNFKGDLYLNTVSLASPHDEIVYKYSGVGTSWSSVLTVSSINSARYGLSVSSDTLTVQISADILGDTFDLRKTTDGSAWSSVSSPSADDWDLTDFGGGDTDSNVPIDLRNITNTNRYKSYMGYSDSNLTLGAEYFNTLGLYTAYQRGCIDDSAAARYFRAKTSPYYFYRSFDYGTTLYQCGEQYAPYIYGVNSVDFWIQYDAISPYDLTIYYYKTGDTPYTDWSTVETAPVTAVDDNSLVGVAKLNNELFVFVETSIYKSTIFDDWPTPTPPAPTSTHQLVQSISTPYMGGDYFWTTWLSDETMRLHKRRITNGELVANISLGAMTLAQIAIGQYSAYVVAFDDDTIYVYGRLNDPQGLGICHVIKSEDGGTTWAVVENGWGTDKCGAYIVTATGACWAIRNGSTVNLYGGNGSALTQYSTTPFNQPVSRGGFVIAPNGNMYAASRYGDSVMVARSSPPYTAWVDVTSDHDTDNGIKRLVAF